MKIDSVDSAVEKAKKGLVFQPKTITKEKEILYKTFLEKQVKNPYMIVPDEDVSYKYVCQHHYRGKTCHTDYRIESEKKEFLIGWTLADLIKGVITKPVETMTVARKWDKTSRAWKIDWKTGKFKLRRTRAGTLVPAEIRAFEKAVEPHEWLKVEGVTPPFPAPGATKEFRGVFTVVDDGIGEYGSQKLDFHEYFLSKGKLKGRLVTRRLVRGQFQKEYDIDNDIEESLALEENEEIPLWHFKRNVQLYLKNVLGWQPEKIEKHFPLEKKMIDIEKQFGEIMKERQAVLPPGTPEERLVTATFWVAIQPKDQTPYVLQKRAVDKKWMPPDGKSALPKVIRRQIPSEYQYWKEKGKKAQKVRDDLVKAIKEKEVEIDIDIIAKNYEIEKQESGKSVLQFHWWRGPVVVRRGASEYHFDFRAYFGKTPFDHWVLEENPLEQPEGVSAIFKSCRDVKTLDVEFNPPPKDSPLAEYKKRSIPFNTELNPTKATPAFIQKIDSGRVIKLIDKPLFKKYQVTTGKMKGVWIIERKTPTEKIWKFSKSALPKT